MSIIHKSKSNEYYTPITAWDDIIHIIKNSNKKYIEPFNNIDDDLSIVSRNFLKKHLNIIDTGIYNSNTNENNFFDIDINLYDICISNPPFSIKQKILYHLHIHNKPFILILPTSTLNTIYFKKWFSKDIQLIIPKKRINFNYYLDNKKSCCFDCIYFCYKIGLEKDIYFLE